MDGHLQHAMGKAGGRSRGFTMAELLVALAVFSMVIAGSIPAYVMCLRTWARTSVDLQASHESSMAVERLVYGVGAQYGLRSAVSTTVVVNASAGNWTVTYRDIGGGSNMFTYSSTNKTLSYDGIDTTNAVIVGRDIIAASVTNSARGLSISVQTLITDGRFSASNRETTFVAYRN